MTNITLTLEQRVHKVELSRAQNSIALTFPQRLHKVVLSPTGIQAPAGGGVTDGDKGDVTVSAGGGVWTIKDAVVTDAKIASVNWSKIDDAPASFASTIALVAGLQDALDAKQDALGFIPEDAAQKGVPGGYAALDGAGKLNPSTLPAIAVTDTFVVASESAMLALTAETGDVAVRTDVSRSFILRGADPAILANWVELATPTDAVASIFGRTGVVTAQLGDYTTAQVTESGNLYFTEARARAVPLTGYAAAGSRTALAAADTILGAFGKIGKWLSDLAAVAFSGSASDLTQGTLPAARIQDGSLALGKLANVATSTILGRVTAGAGAPEALTGAQATGLLDTFTSGAKGLAPASGGKDSDFLRGDGLWRPPPQAFRVAQVPGRFIGPQGPGGAISPNTYTANVLRMATVCFANDVVVDQAVIRISAGAAAGHAGDVFVYELTAPDTLTKVLEVLGIPTVTNAAHPATLTPNFTFLAGRVYAIGICHNNAPTGNLFTAGGGILMAGAITATQTGYASTININLTQGAGGPSTITLTGSMFSTVNAQVPYFRMV